MMSSDFSAGISRSKCRRAETVVIWVGSRPLNRDEALISALRRSAEEWVSDDWAAVARAINQRVAELGLRQRELAERSGVSQAIVREIQRNTVQRQRGARTLEALSVALDWHPEHLTAVLGGHRPPEVDEPVTTDVPGRLSAIERHLRVITRQLATMNANLETVINRGGDE
jgi:transcriptional regulator with XRE-family HTH domain